MTIRRLALRNLRYYARVHLAAVLGVAAGGAALIGALLVGDSMRGSLRDAALQRLGRIETVLRADRFFRAALADAIAPPPPGATEPLAPPSSVAPLAAPAIVLAGGVSAAETAARVEGVQVLGVDRRFWQLARGAPQAPPTFDGAGRVAILNHSLARALGVSTGDELLVRIGKPSAVSTETLLGRRDDTTRTLRLRLVSTVADDDVGAFSEAPLQQPAANVFVPLETLQRAVDQPRRANRLLLRGARGAEPPAAGDSPLGARLESSLTLADYGVRLIVDPALGYLSVESDRLLIEPPLEQAARAAAGECGAASVGVLAYLANEIGLATGGTTTPIPYSTLAAIEPGAGDATPAARLAADGLLPAPGEVVLNQWAADRLGAAPGDEIALRYFVTGAGGELETQRSTFTLRAILPLAGVARDPRFVPTLPGVTDAERMTDWDPPFPVDLGRIRAVDEAYWDASRTTPKAFLSFADAARLFAEDPERFGLFTTLRVYPPTRAALDEFRARFEARLLSRLSPAAFGFVLEPVRSRALAAAAGNTDFGGLFIGFSFFLIVSAAMLVALLFRLAVERRAGELGVLTAIGYPPATLFRLLLLEGLALAATGTLIALIAAPAYAALMLAGLRSWWSGAVNAPFLQLHASAMTLAIGTVAGILVAAAATAFALRGLLRAAPRALLAGVVPPRGVARAGRRPAALWLSVASMLAAAALISAAALGRIPAAGGFFGGGAALLVAGLAVFRHLLVAPRSTTAWRPGCTAWLRLAVTNAARQPGRSVLTAGLIAAASFLIAALGAFRLEIVADPGDPRSGVGGFALFAEAATPLPYDLNSPAGRAALGVEPEAEAVLAQAEFVPLRLRPGDAASCLNLYGGARRRLVGVDESFIARGAFRFSAALPGSEEQRRNPWLLLNRRFDDGAIPVIGDEAAVMWQLHRGLGQDLDAVDGRGRPVRLRFVALLAGSALQDELIVAERDFIRLFPSVDGHAFFLIRVAPQASAGVVETAERSLAPYAFDVGSTIERLDAYNRVQNTYLSTFQTLGGLGLVLGVFGLAAVMLRNVRERRAELGLMAALGYSRIAIAVVVLAENALLLLFGLATGVIAAAVAVTPQLLRRAEAVPWASLSLTLAGVLVVGLLAGAVALRPALGAPPLRALRSE